MKNFTQPLTNLKACEDALDCIQRGQTVQITGCSDSKLVNFMQALGDNIPQKVVLTYDARRAQSVCDDLTGTGENAVCYPAKDFLFFSADIHGNAILKERIKAILKIFKRESCTFVLSFDGLMDRILPKSVMRDNLIIISAGSKLDITKLKGRLSVMGYETADSVERPGEYSVRGGIVDIYPLDSELPYRIDLWDDEVDLIKTFDPGSQRSVENISQFTIGPATEYPVTPAQKEAGLKKIQNELYVTEQKLRADFQTEAAYRLKITTEEFIEQAQFGARRVQPDSYVNYFFDELSSLIDYFDDDALFFIEEPQRIEEITKAQEEAFGDSMSHRLAGGYILPGQAEVMWPYSDILEKLKTRRKVLFSMFARPLKAYDPVKTCAVTARNITPYSRQFSLLAEDLKNFKKQGYAVLLLSPSRARGERLAKNLEEYDVHAVFNGDCSRVINPKETVVSVGSIHKGFVYPEIKFAVISEEDIFGAVNQKKRRRKKFSGKHLSDFNELKPGDYVVHENHGIGIYRGIENVVVDHVAKDYIKIEYDGGGFLYIAATQFNLIQKYSGADGDRPKLNRLGDAEWSKTKRKVKRAVDDIAKDLVDLYAARQTQTGYTYGKDTVWQKEFEEQFPYEETQDQLNAINDVKADMESGRIMDRLICGDVGFGKTEVALRAAFKAVQDGKQVAYLVPTTVLAQQHYNTFLQRFKNFPVRVDLLSRFCTKAQAGQTVTDLRKGSVDIVIGTHRLLSADVVFKDLGLLVIDEEQRFGVRHKEKIKKLKENVDVISLSATPIPRTLHMSLTGIRDISLIEEPPQNRMPVQTYVMEYSEEIAREAISRELARGGQVYYIYNNVAHIDEVAASVSRLVPDANVAYAHGQMSERMIESVMYDFVNGDIDVLVSTTIVETGMDIPNVNTIIIRDADRLGLSQLYQLRGRVGRSNRKAYAFIMYRRDKILKEVAEKRLTAIRDFSDLGSGYKIAMRDLEIRGAGNLLGSMQHGHLNAVGYDLYCKMLNEAVELKRGIRGEEGFETALDLNVNAYIPESYISNEEQKLDIYKRIAGIENQSEKEEMEDELLDRFGDIPAPVENLLSVSLLKARANSAYITEVTGGGERLRFSMWSRAKIDGAKIPALIETYRGNLKFKPGAEPYFLYTPDAPFADFGQINETAMRVIGDIAGLKEDADEKNADAKYTGAKDADANYVGAKRADTKYAGKKNADAK